MGGTAHCGLSPPTSIIYQENAPRSDGGLFSIEIPSSQIALVFVKLTKKNYIYLSEKVPVPQCILRSEDESQFFSPYGSRGSTSGHHPGQTSAFIHSAILLAAFESVVLIFCQVYSTWRFSSVF